MSRFFNGQSWLFFSIAVVPILIYEGFGIAYREPKSIGLWILAGILAWQLSRHTWGEASPLIKFFAKSASALLALSFCSTLYATNFGLAIERCANLAATFIVAIYFYQRRIDINRTVFALSVALALVNFFILLRVFEGISLMDLGSGLGSLIGERNPCAIYMAALFPLTVAYFVTAREREYSREIFWAILSQATFFSIIIGRCRNSWWMLIIYAAVFAIFSILKTNIRPFAQRSVTSMVVMLVISLTVILNAPLKLKWRAENAYKESFLSMADPSLSNGRVELWRLGLVMARENPLLGVGAGNTVIEMRPYVPSVAVDPKVFAFLRSDLPIFNDYIQAFAELGVIGGTLFFIIFAGLPVSLLFHLICSKRRIQIEHLAVVLGLIGVSVSSIFDYSLVRPETMLLFAIFSGIALQFQSDKIVDSCRKPSRSARWCLRIGSVFLLSMAVCYGGSFTLRLTHAMELAWKLWPYDASWNESFALYLRETNQRELLNEYLLDREKYWPHDPRTIALRATTAYFDQDFVTAAKYYSRALLEVPGGRCNWYSWYNLDKFYQDMRVPEPLRAEARAQLYQCSR